jgi:hypothetical protein
VMERVSVLSFNSPDRAAVVPFTFTKLVLDTLAIPPAPSHSKVGMTEVESARVMVTVTVVESEPATSGHMKVVGENVTFPIRPTKAPAAPFLYVTITGSLAGL